MDVLPSKRSPPDGFSAAPSGGIAPPADSRTADVFFRSPNPRRLAGRRLRPELRVASRRPRLSRQRRSSARKAAASEVKLQYKRYGTQVRTGIRRRTAAASRNGLRRASGCVFPSASLRTEQREGAGLYSRVCAPFCLLCAAPASPRFPARQRGKPISPGQPFTNASGGPPSLSCFASPAALAGSGTRRPRAP